ncbi:MAG: hypothetical protein L3J66_06800 [Bacteroidales bacterium]|nr:hypothetical protein [Bacteroidales bacterium]
MEENKKKENIFKQMFITRTLGFIDISKKRDFWKDFAKETNGIFNVKHTVAKDLEILILKIPYKKYLVEFTESDTHPLKINCKLNANYKFDFFISYEDTIERLLKFFGNQDIEIGDETFDKKYLIQGEKPDLIKKVVMKDRIKTILLSNNVFSYHCIYEKKNETIQLTSLVSRTVNSKSELSELFELFCLTIDEMEKLDIILHP